jgi:UDP-glucose 4-epimerase
MHENAVDPLGEFRKINVEVTRQIAQAAVQAGVPRLVFISSIKVNGEATRPGNPFRASSPAAPQDPYGISKYEAEVMLRELGEESGLEVVIIRPPLVYGPGVGGNFFRLLKLAHSGLPLPFGSVSNKRARIAVENLADAILAACTKELNGVTVLLVNDQESISTSQLLRKLSEYLGKPTRLLPFPSAVLSGGLALIGKKAEADRLLDSLEVEVSSDPPGYEWIPPYSTDEALERTARWFRECTGRSK